MATPIWLPGQTPGLTFTYLSPYPPIPSSLYSSFNIDPEPICFMSPATILAPDTVTACLDHLNSLLNGLPVPSTGTHFACLPVILKQQGGPIF